MIVTLLAERLACTIESHEPGVLPSEPEIIDGICASTPANRMSSYRLMMSCDEGFALERRPNCFAAESDVAVAPSCVDQTTTARPAAEDGETERQRRRKGGKKGGRNGGGKKKGSGDASRRLCEAGQRMQCDEGLELKRRHEWSDQAPWM